MAKKQAVVGRSAVALSMLLRGGSGRHADRRLKRNKDRSAQRRNAIKDAA